MISPLLAPHPVEPDFISEDFYRDPYRHYAVYRSETPVFRSRDGVVYLTRYADCEFLLTDGRFRRQPPGGSGMNPFEREQQQPNALDLMVGHWMVFMDPPRHDVVRQAFSAAFSVKAVRLLDPAIRSVVGRLIDAWRGRSTVELVSAFATPLPIFILCEMLGVPSEDWPRFNDWSSQIMRAMDSGTKEEMQTAIPTSIEIRDYFTDLVRTRTTSPPRGDLLDDLIMAGKTGKLTHDELIFGIALLLIAGHETTKDLIASGILTLAEHPDQAQELRRQPDLLESAVEELLRFQSPFQKFSRWTSTPVSFGEYGVAEGTLVTVLIGAANRDPTVFVNPEQFDIRRAPNRHLAFSRGVHACMGAMLARLESRIALDALLRALPEIKVIEHRWRPKSAFRALECLTLSLD